jgi:hypothetical protein
MQTSPKLLGAQAAMEILIPSSCFGSPLSHVGADSEIHQPSEFTDAKEHKSV